jgi:hypothetical protein
VFPIWQVNDTCQSQKAPCYFDKTRVVDRLPLFSCISLPAEECDLYFDTNPDLQNTFGRVGYNLQLVATVSRASTNPSQLNLTNLAFGGYIYDFYQWNPAENFKDHAAAAVQAGFNSLGNGGQIYGTTVNLLTSGLDGFSWIFQ